MKATELADAIRESKVYQDLQAARAALSLPEAVRCNEAYDKVWAEVQSALKSQTMTSEDAADRLRKAREERDGCPQVREYMQALRAYHREMDNISELLGTLLGEKSGAACSGNCSGCRT